MYLCVNTKTLIGATILFSGYINRSVSFSNNHNNTSGRDASYAGMRGGQYTYTYGLRYRKPLLTNSQLNTGFGQLSTGFSQLSTGFSQLSTGFGQLNTGFRVRSTQYRVQSTQYRVRSTQYRAQ